MNFSYWEQKEWFSNIDFTVVGSGIVGLNCALTLREKNPNAKILVLEKGVLPQGASTKNAGFACFGSISELVDDLKTHTKEEVYNLVEKRWKGLQKLREILGDETIDFQEKGGYELFENENDYNEYASQLEEINALLHPIFNQDVFKIVENTFQFKNCYSKLIKNVLEGQIDTGKMMHFLLKKAQEKDINILNAIQLISFEDESNEVSIKTEHITFKTKKLCIATNGFAHQLLEENIKPARAQVLITKPIKNLHIEGTFHIDKGYYYFRNINNRILFGGGRNLDFKTEETTTFGQTKIVQSKLKEYLKDTILPNTAFEIDYNWSGIMGVGNQKKPIVKKLSENVFCGIRLGGMGVAIGSLVGTELAELTNA